MNSSSGNQALQSQFEDLEERSTPEPDLSVVPNRPRPLEDPIFRYVFLGFLSLFLILGIAAFFSL